MSTHQQAVADADTTVVAEVTLTPKEERKWNQLSIMMNRFHQHFKTQFNSIYGLSDGSFSKRGSLNMYLRSVQQLIQGLTMHHTIEEAHFFPLLAKKMPQFAKDNDAGHIESHKGIHNGLDALELLLKKYSTDATTYSPAEMRGCLDSFKGVLFRHLDEEVDDLRGENLRKYFTLEEIEQLAI